MRDPNGTNSGKRREEASMSRVNMTNLVSGEETESSNLNFDADVFKMSDSVETVCNRASDEGREHVYVWHFVHDETNKLCIVTYTLGAVSVPVAATVVDRAYGYW
jgi:hypothetical protein